MWVEGQISSKFNNEENAYWLEMNISELNKSIRKLNLFSFLKTSLIQVRTQIKVIKLFFYFYFICYNRIILFNKNILIKLLY